MLIQDSVDHGDAIRLDVARAVRPPRSPARLFAEGVWFLTWHGGQAAVQGAGRFLLAAAIRRERQALAQLDDRELRDIGIDRASALREASRAFGDVPLARLPRRR